MAFVIGNANKMLLLLFEIKALIDRIVGAWKFEVGKKYGSNITRQYLPKGLTMLFLLPVIAILVNELNIKLLFFAANKASESFVSSAVRMLLLSSGKFPLCAFNFDYKYLDSGYTRPPVLEKKGFDLFHFFRLRKRIL